MRNWKTSLAGVSTILAVFTKIVNGHVDWGTDIPILIAAIGLLVAKDHNVTGGSVPQ